MDGKKVLEVIRIYRRYFKKAGILKKKFPHEQFIGILDTRVLAHCHWMLDQMEQFIAEGRMDKAFRWLGFIQGCLWSTGHYDLEDLKNHNRPDSAD